MIISLSLFQNLAQKKLGERLQPETRTTASATSSASNLSGNSQVNLMPKSHAKQCCEATTPESIHTKDESKREIAFAFIFGVN